MKFLKTIFVNSAPGISISLYQIPKYTNLSIKLDI